MARMLFTVLFTGTLVLSFATDWRHVAMAGSRSNADAWLKSHSLVPLDGFMVRRVHQIFDDVKRASDALVHPSRLFIIQSNSIPWAIALEDKNIVLTSGAIDVIYSSDDALDKKDARMAFVLGHELKHVVDNDFSHQQAYNSFSREAVSDLVSTDGSANTRKTLELLADEEGLINASLAGYDTSAIFSDIGDADNFLEYWARQTNTSIGDHHYTPRERIDFLKNSYKSIDNLVEFFKYGVRLSHFGDQENARVLLEDFHKVYESSRVLTNRGFVHLQLAREAMPEQLAYRYWFPDLLDLESGFPVSASRSVSSKLPEEARVHLMQAVTLLKKSLELSEDNHAARMNLISAYLFLNEFSSARAMMDAIADWDASPHLLSLDAIVVMQDKRLKNPWDTFTLEELQQSASADGAPADLIYNYARILQENDRAEQAQHYWSTLVNMLSSMPQNYQVMVCRQMQDKRACSQQISYPGDEPLPWQLQINPGDSINSQKVGELLKSWNTEPVKSVSGIDAQIYPDGKGNSLLILDGKVKLVCIKQHGVEFTDVLQERFGLPSQIVRSGNEDIWSYGSGWSALVAGNEVKEIWVAR